MHTHKMRSALKIVSAHIQRTTRGHHIPLCINTNTFQLMHKIDTEDLLMSTKVECPLLGSQKWKGQEESAGSKWIYKNNLN